MVSAIRVALDGVDRRLEDSAQYARREPRLGVCSLSRLPFVAPGVRIGHGARASRKRSASSEPRSPSCRTFRARRRRWPSRSTSVDPGAWRRPTRALRLVAAVRGVVARARSSRSETLARRAKRRAVGDGCATTLDVVSATRSAASTRRRVQRRRGPDRSSVPSGAGKTSVLDAMAGILRPD